MKKNVIILTIGLFFCSSVFAKIKEKPTLFINIVIENMSPDYLDIYYSDLWIKGFKRLMTNGAYFNNVSYPYPFSQTGVDHATIYTGKTPNKHGIISHKWYDRIKKKVISNIGNINPSDSIKSYTSKYLKTYTIGDKLKIINSMSRVYSVAINPESSIISGGHFSDASYWFNIKTGDWNLFSTNKKTNPDWLNVLNQSRFVDNYTKEAWKSKFSGYYNNYSKVDNKSFKYDVKGIIDKENSYRFFTETPFANVAITDLVEKIIINENLGRDKDVDIVNLSYSLLGNNEEDFSPSSLEKLDALKRLDDSIGRLIDFTNEKVGEDKVVYLLTFAEPQHYYTQEIFDTYLQPKVFNTFRVISLLKSYLNIKIGKGDWISSYDSYQIYLNKDYIDKREKSLKKIQDIIVDFLSDFSGVNSVYPSYILHEKSMNSKELNNISNIYCSKRSGDIFYILDPNWKVERYDREVSFSRNSSLTNVPLIIYGKGIEAKEYFEKKSILDIAPTIYKILGIRNTENCVGEAIDL